MLEVVEIIRKIEQGRTEPYLCGANDGNKYVVKGKTTQGKGRIVEYICAHIGKAFELPIPDFNIIEVPDFLLEYDPAYQMDIGSGPAFASMYIPHLQEVNLSIVDIIDNDLLQNVFLFDYWIRNEDRTLGDTGGNPNLIFRPVDEQLYVLDHNLAFDDDYTFEDMRKLHVCRKAWFGKQMDMLKINEYQERMEAALTDLDACINSLPVEWFSCSTVKDDLIDIIVTQLNSYKENEFWEQLQ